MQQLCAQMADLNSETLFDLGLPEGLYASIQQASKLKSSNARNRQLRHSAKLLNVEPELLDQVEHFFEERKGQARKEQQRHKQIEYWRDRLLDVNENALSALFQEFPETDRQQLSTLVRNARKEKQLEKPPAQQRKLFKYLRDQVI